MAELHFLQSYGPEHLLTFSNLRRAGLLTEQAPGDTLTAVESKVSKLVTDKAAGKITDAFSSLAKRSNFRAISKKLNLIPRVDGEYDLKVPRDMAYVFSGAYVPLSCRLIEQVRGSHPFMCRPLPSLGPWPVPTSSHSSN
uniref:Uncharacterized protein n=1 Tax=Mustela putorius furo TaxID=9669 RepID=M3YW95_MUSPF